MAPSFTSRDRSCPYCAEEVSAGTNLCPACGLSHNRARQRQREDDKVKVQGVLGDKLVWGGVACFVMGIILIVGAPFVGWTFTPHTSGPLILPFVLGVTSIATGRKRAHQRDAMRARRLARAERGPGSSSTSAAEA